MKKLVKISIMFLVFFNITITVANAQVGKILAQGIYDAKTSNLLMGTAITARITSPNDRAIIIIIDSNQLIQELVRLTPESTEHVLKPLNYGSSIIIFTNGSITFT